jgi:serine/threonine-protein kinase HipA
MMFSVLVSNTDDHLRNHGFLRAEKGWRLAPAYDMNPTPTDVKPRIHALALDETDPTAAAETLLAIAPRVGLTSAAAREIAAEVGAAVSGWASVAKAVGLKAGDIERMESAFEHEDATTVRKLAKRSGSVDQPTRRTTSTRKATRAPAQPTAPRRRPRKT